MGRMRPWAVQRFAGLAFVALVAASCAVPGGSTPELTGNYVSVPPVPFPSASAFAVDLDRLDELACLECAAGDADSARFFYGVLPLAATDALHGTSDVRAELGNLFLSGYFGGLYLRDSLGSSESGEESDGDQNPMSVAVSDAIGGATHAALDGTVQGLVYTAQHGSPNEVRIASLALAPVMAAIYGYNRGYLEVAIENPPGGTVAPPALECESFFTCRTDTLPLAALDTLEPTAQALVSPPDALWSAVATSLHDTGTRSVEGGRQVWERLLDGTEFDAEAYTAIIDLSYGFLEVTEAALLGLAEGVVGDVELGRTGLLAASGLLVWAGSYFLGLAADAPSGELPALLCAGAGD